VSVVDKGVLKAAQAAERRGEVEQALRLYQRAGVMQDAARLLAGLERFTEAAQVILVAVGVPPDRAGRLDRAGKKLCLQAALYATKAKQHDLAATLYEALGKQEQALHARALAEQAAAAQALQHRDALDVNALQALHRLTRPA